jgi:hypothetical protein
MADVRFVAALADRGGAVADWVGDRVYSKRLLQTPQTAAVPALRRACYARRHKYPLASWPGQARP